MSIRQNIVWFGGGACLALMLIGILMGSFLLLGIGIAVGTAAAVLE